MKCDATYENLEFNKRHEEMLKEIGVCYVGNFVCELSVLEINNIKNQAETCFHMNSVHLEYSK